MRRTILAVLGMLAFGSAADAKVVTIPFDFGRGEVDIEARIGSERLHAFLDTGVDPSVIDFQLAEKLQLPIDRSNSFEASGEGNNASAKAFPAKIVGLGLGGREVTTLDAATADLTSIAADYGKPVGAILGYSFLKRQLTFIDYQRDTVSFLDNPAEAGRLVRTCRKRYQTRLILLKGLNWPVIPAFRFGRAVAPVSLDTGSNSSISLYQSALTLPGVRAALKEKGATEHGGFRGNATVKAYTLSAPVGFGPFRLSAGQEATVWSDAGSRATRVANVGNQILAAMKLKMLLDYRDHRLSFWGDCA